MGKSTSATSTQVSVRRVSRAEYASASATTGAIVDPPRGYLHLDHAAHAVVAHPAELQAEHGVGAGLVERDAKAVHVARHGLRLRDQMAVGRIEAEAVVHVERGDAKLHHRPGRHGHSRRELAVPGRQRRARAVGQRPRILFPDGVDDAIRRACLDRVGQPPGA